MLMLPPETPSRMRATKTQPMVGANASIAQPIVAPIWLMIRTRLRPIRSETCPHSGAETNWQNENVAKSTPTMKGEAPKCVTKYGSIGISMLNPMMSMNVTPRIGSSLRIMRGLYRQDYRCEPLALAQDVEFVRRLRSTLVRIPCRSSRPVGGAPRRRAHVARFESRRVGRAAGLDRHHDDRAPVVEAEAPRGGRCEDDVLPRDAEIAAPYFSVAHQQTGDVSRRVDRDCKAETLTGKDGGVDADDFAARRDQRTAGVPGVERGIGLNDVVDQASRLRAQGAPERADDAGGDGVGEAERITRPRRPAAPVAAPTSRRERRARDRARRRAAPRGPNAGSSPTSARRQLAPVEQGDADRWASWTTWLLVSTKPSGVKTNPEPLPPCRPLRTSMLTTAGLTRSAAAVTASRVRIECGDAVGAQQGYGTWWSLKTPRPIARLRR